jgi:3',5'-cyclic AMP phosphodiesterase CpdA
MRTIVQLSDLHFGATLFTTIDPLLAAVNEIAPDLVVISGDLTQRARVAQFRDARAFLERLPQPQLVIPGNHDVPLYDFVRRFVAPLQRYAQFITDNFSPSYIDDEIAVVGINTARSLVFKGGEISESQLDTVALQFATATNGQVRIVTAHHPFDVPPEVPRIRPVEGAEAAVRRFAELRVDLVLSGHLHMIHEISASQLVAGYPGTILHAGTATSTRSRGEPNSFFVIRTGDPIEVETWKWNDERELFERAGARHVERVSGTAHNANTHGRVEGQPQFRLPPSYRS